MIEDIIIVSLITQLIIEVVEEKYKLITRYEIMIQEKIKPSFKVCFLCFVFWISLNVTVLTLLFSDYNYFNLAKICFSSVILTHILDKYLHG